MKNNFTKGAVEVTTVVTWAIGLFVSTSLAFTGMTAASNSAQNDTLREHEGRLSGAEAAISRIPYIEGKLDKALERQGVDPRLVEDEIARQLREVGLATTTLQSQ
jgi:hypothetical protein